MNSGAYVSALRSYLSIIRKWILPEPVIHIDDSDVVKPDGYKFEAFGIVRDGSQSTDTKSVYKKGYHVRRGIIGTKSEPGINSYDGADSFGCPPCFFAYAVRSVA